MKIIISSKLNQNSNTIQFHQHLPKILFDSSSWLTEFLLFLLLLSFFLSSPFSSVRLSLFLLFGRTCSLSPSLFFFGWSFFSLSLSFTSFFFLSFSSLIDLLCFPLCFYFSFVTPNLQFDLYFGMVLVLSEWSLHSHAYI
ncbi:hypothetical protein ACOSQ4_016918 [Xanthoceras sorbifolium]